MADETMTPHANEYENVKFLSIRAMEEFVLKDPENNSASPRWWRWAVTKWEADREEFRLLVAAVNADTEECLPGCNSFGHAEGCKSMDMATTLINLRKRLEAAEQRVGQLETWILDSAHQPGCCDNWLIPGTKPCRCGLDAMCDEIDHKRAALAREEKQKPG